ncbi:MAG TPA: hypothetical protein VMJ10_20680 [Kofleriaceae bacterium]|nr:hypothetical protein [Kofleriaceae bacterium]
MLRSIIAIAIVTGCAADQTKPPVESSGDLAVTIFVATQDSTCLNGQLEVPLLCTVSDVQHRGAPNQVETLMPQCDYSDSVPCWSVQLERDRCQTTTQLQLSVTRDQAAPAGTETVAACARD